MDKLELERYIKKAVELLNKKYDLPSEGFLAGGSLGNTIWKLTGGEKAIINDIDIFSIKLIDTPYKDYCHDKWKEKYENDKNNEYLEVGFDIKEDYSNIQHKENDNYISFYEEYKSGIFNFVEMESNILDYNFILKSFDINCCEVGYDLENKKAYFTESFFNFINSRELKSTSLLSANKTILRLFKKNDELSNTIFNKDYEIKKLTYSFSENVGFGKLDFFGLEKYLDMYKKYEDELKDYVNLAKFSVNNKTKFTLQNSKWEDTRSYKGIIKNDELSLYLKEKKLYIRKGNYEYFYDNIYHNPIKLKLWEKLSYFYNNDDYLDVDYNERIVEIYALEEYLKIYDNLYRSFLGYNLSKQLDMLKLIKQIELKDPTLVKCLKYNGDKIVYEDKDDLEFGLKLLNIKYRKEIHDSNQIKRTNNDDFGEFFNDF